jgi:hypothetical protein
MADPAMIGNIPQPPNQEPKIDITGVGGQGAGKDAEAGNVPQSWDHPQQPAVAQPTMDQVVQILWADRTQTQVLNQQLQQQLSQVQTQVRSQATFQPSAQDFKYKPSTPDSLFGASSKLEG